MSIAFVFKGLREKAFLLYGGNGSSQLMEVVMTGFIVSEIWQYPIKGCAGESLKYAPVSKRGFNYDRRWMVVDENGMFVTQRGQGSSGIGVRSICLVRAKIRKRFCVVTAPGMTELIFPTMAHSFATCDVQVWDWRGIGIEVSRTCSDWFTEYLSRERPGTYRLVQIAEHVPRRAKTGTSHMSFGDGFPFLVTSEASLAEVNSRIQGDPVSMNRFRPNIVISGCEAHAEDRMDHVFIGNVFLRGQKLCERCAVPATIQETGGMDSRPLAALATYRRWKDDEGKMKVWFGRNFNHRGTGVIHRGSVLEVL